MKETLRVINAMAKLRIIGKYAIAGSVAVIYYSEPIQTNDLDVFFLYSLPASGLIDLGSVYQYCREKGFSIEKETIKIKGIPVQFMPAVNSLEAEAVRLAKSINFAGVPTRVVTLEHLIAMKLKAARPKDLTHLVLLLSSVKPDYRRLNAILGKYKLTDRWEDFRDKYFQL